MLTTTLYIQIEIEIEPELVVEFTIDTSTIGIYKSCHKRIGRSHNYLSYESNNTSNRVLEQKLSQFYSETT